MQPAEEVRVGTGKKLDFTTMFLFQYCRGSRVALEEQTQRDFGHNLCGKYDYVSGYFSDIKKSILLQPHIKGTLIQFGSRTEWEIRTKKLYTSKELFTLRFDRDKAKVDLKEWLSLQRHFSVLTKLAHVESRLSGRKRHREVVFYTPVNLYDRRACSASVAVGL